MAELLSAEAVRVGAVRGRYFRENFAQGGIDLVQIVPELVTNADAAIAASGRSRGRIEVRFGAPDPAFLAAWRAQMRAMRVPALRSWRFEASCADDGVGVNAATVDRRLGALGKLPELELGFAKSRLPQMAARGVAERVKRGLYRFPALQDRRAIRDDHPRAAPKRQNPDR
jgi:hypothetical protein